ncbi:MAG TPA: S9 family peptidase [Gemmatimonadaceae bacterium]|jgi:oligopeptidase B|nr:S9 family peptidase [Gemmatimonadaceae bacterium]
MAPALARAQSADSAAIPPTAKMIPRVDTTLGDERVDSYFWLRDDQRKNPEVLAYLAAENRYTEAMLRHTEGLQARLFDEMKGRIKETDLSVPQRDGRYFYYSRTEAGQQYPILCRKKEALTAPEEVMLDENALGRGRGYFHIGTWRVSADDRLLAYTIDTTGAERYLLVVKDLTTGRMLGDSVVHVNYSLEWGNDNRTVFYGNSDSANRPFEIARHVLGSPQSKDSVVVHEPDPLFNLELSKTKDRAYLLVRDESFDAADVRYLAAATPGQPFRTLVPRRDSVLVREVEHRGKEFLVLTNERAFNYRLMAVGDADPAHGAWQEVVAQHDSVLLEGFEVFRDYIVLYERGHARHWIHVLDPVRHGEFDVPFADSISTFFRGDNPTYDGTVLRYTYTSFLTPATVYDFDLTTRAATVKKVTEVLGGYDPTRYVTERTWATASDGARVPVSLVYRGPLMKDGTRPMLLYGYGSYGISTDPVFNSAAISLLDRGVIYAIAHVRGGQEMGRGWYEQGRLLTKRNTFTDFIAAAEHLIAAKYTSSDRLAMRGGSAGGLLMGAVVNLRPDLFKCVVADVPFVDVINTMSDSTIPLTTEEWLQWGDPRREPYYGYMKSYSPYDNVARKKYPAMLVTAGLNDPRVGYWEPAKWVARLRASKTDDHLLLLRTNMGAGHGGASGRYDALHEQAIRYAFILDQLGLSSGTVP